MRKILVSSLREVESTFVFRPYVYLSAVVALHFLDRD
jgi:hypothetical protein